eukprot:gnl/MRDRNA2_/MRDRNA2_150094_c0_seq1.p1 gnl/MRDRNA2_/MRDRNA2_150094_c0~~gnl/MRDRNA2_/MRDRNA2_150094_c0_seq1.p1  ORF type:complete len:205 (+),score=15.81 gnl/MRDRNA2_/MRDRNA2_150094_c0_seq1:104-718(+)
MAQLTELAFVCIIVVSNGQLPASHWCPLTPHWCAMGCNVKCDGPFRVESCNPEDKNSKGECVQKWLAKHHAETVEECASKCLRPVVDEEEDFTYQANLFHYDWSAEKGRWPVSDNCECEYLSVQEALVYDGTKDWVKGKECYKLRSAFPSPGPACENAPGPAPGFTCAPDPLPPPELPNWCRMGCNVQCMNPPNTLYYNAIYKE